MPTWNWEETDPERSGSSGDISKLFRAETTKNPGVFELDAPSPNATVMAREVIQNSWDAARERPDSPDFHIDFTFDSVAGAAKENLVRVLDLRDLAERAASGDRPALGLRDEDSLQTLADDIPLNVMTIRESGTTGMYGPFKGRKSKLYLALISIGFTEKVQGAGGSFGYGKAGLIRGSAIRTVVAYTCFSERQDDPGVTRRLLGMVYWGEHTHGGVSYTGFARMGQGKYPFENDSADEVAASLEMRLRDATELDDLGSTFLLLEPTVNPDDLVRAIERSWWPALIDNPRFGVSVRREDGEILHPRPRRDEALKPFIRAFELATVPQDNSRSDEKTVTFQPIATGAETHERPGTLGLVADLHGWSYAEDLSTSAAESFIEHKSLVALVRAPRMVVEYFEAGHTTPYVRGAFVAGNSVDDQLRLTEPKGHDAWQTNLDDGDAERRAAAVAAAVINRIKTNVQTFRRQLKPPTPPPEQMRLPVFDSIIRRLMSGRGKGWRPPTADIRPISIRLRQEPQVAGAGLVRMSGNADLALTEHFAPDTAEAQVTVTYRFVEDGRVGEFCQLFIDAPAGFSPVSDAPGSYRGTLTHAERVEFRFVSEPYSIDWTGRLFVSAEVIKPSNPEVAPLEQ